MLSLDYNFDYKIILKPEAYLGLIFKKRKTNSLQAKKQFAKPVICHFKMASIKAWCY